MKLSHVPNALKSRLSRDQIRRLKRARGFLTRAAGPLVGRDLILLAKLCGTDKWGSHWYAQHYQEHFRRFRNKPIKVLEIGIGGYDDPHAGGESLRMWRAYFPRATIYGLDITDKSPHAERRIKIYQGSQADERVLQTIVDDSGGLDIIIDDGSHINSHVITTFEYLFPRLNNGGIYAAEDTQTSYWGAYGGSSEDLSSPKSMMPMFKGLVDGLNHEEIHRPGYRPTYFDQHIASLHFYHNLVFIQKGDNMEGSISVRDNVLPEHLR
jgi:hypothetical protein